MPYASRSRRRSTSRRHAGTQRSYRVRSASRSRKRRVSSRGRHSSPRIVIQLVNPAAAPSAVGQKGAQPVRSMF